VALATDVTAAPTEVRLLGRAWSVLRDHRAVRVPQCGADLLGVTLRRLLAPYARL
jgi:hypothetical protein